jgi:L-alanine-DL-glutamate epimerase-like enolase superfamily enzyme
MNWTLNGKTIEEIEKSLEEGIRRGYDSCIIKVAPDPKFDVEVVRLVRKRLPKSFLWADANCGYDLQSALEAAPKLADMGLDVLEAPLRPNQMPAIRHAQRLPILMDEAWLLRLILKNFSGWKCWTVWR